MKPEFISDLHISLAGNYVWILDSPLIYSSEIAGIISVPAGFQTDLASVPRLPFIYSMWGSRAHREAVIHDYLYRIGCIPDVPYSTANDVFFEAMGSRCVSPWIAWPMYFAVCFAGWTAFKKLSVDSWMVDGWTRSGS